MDDAYVVSVSVGSACSDHRTRCLLYKLRDLGFTMQATGRSDAFGLNPEVGTGKWIAERGDTIKQLVREISRELEIEL